MENLTLGLPRAGKLKTEISRFSLYPKININTRHITHLVFLNAHSLRSENRIISLLYFFMGATCTGVCNVLHGWSRRQQNEQQQNAPSPKKHCTCRLSESSESRALERCRSTGFIHRLKMFSPLYSEFTLHETQCMEEFGLFTL